MKKLFHIILLLAGLLIVALTVKKYFGNFDVARDRVNTWVDSNAKTNDIKEDSLFKPEYEVFQGNLEKTRIDGEISKLSLSVGGGKFEIVESEDSAIYLSVQNIQRFQYYVEDNCLYFASTSETIKLDRSEESYIVLMLPSDKRFESIEGALATGEFLADGLKSVSTDVRVDAGALNITNLDTDYLFLENGVGKSFVSSNINVAAKVSNNVGMTELNIIGSETDYNLEYNLSLGMITVDGEDIISSDAGAQKSKEDLEKSIDNLVEKITTGGQVDNGADKQLFLDCAVGKIDVDFSLDK